MIDEQNCKVPATLSFVIHCPSIKEECSLSSCPASLSAKNMELHASFDQFASTLSRVGDCVGQLAQQHGR